MLPLKTDRVTGLLYLEINVQKEKSIYYQNLLIGIMIIQLITLKSVKK